MLAALAALVLDSYGFDVSTKLDYELEVKLDGYLPVLNGKTGQAKIQLEFSVQGLSPDKEGRPRAEHNMTRFKAWLNDAVMPFTVENIRSFFPKTVISYDANGRIWASDAPDKDLPSTLPGLSSRQFPEISYLPIEFDPKQPKSWEFTRQISGSPMQFQLREDEKFPSKYAVTSVQTLESFEDGSSRATRKKEDAEYRLSSTIKGDGTIWFNRSKHCVERMSLVVQTETQVKGIVNDFASTRKLTTSLELKLKSAAPSLASLFISGPH